MEITKAVIPTLMAHQQTWLSANQLFIGPNHHPPKIKALKPLLMCIDFRTLLRGYVLSTT
jgi:hypothetical protein